MSYAESGRLLSLNKDTPLGIEEPIFTTVLLQQGDLTELARAVYELQDLV